MPLSKASFAFLCLTIAATSSFSQSRSAVQFYDTTGTTKTGKIGWTGDATTGRFFVQTPADGEIIKTKTGGVEISGNVTATKFVGDGSSLTNLPGPADGSVTTAKIADKAVTDAKIDSVDWAKVKNKPTIPTTLPPNGAAGGDLSGTYPNPTIGAGKVTSGQILDGSIAEGDLNSAVATKLNAVTSLVQSNYNINAQTISSTSATSVISTSVTAPSAGTVTVFATCFIQRMDSLVVAEGSLSTDGTFDAFYYETTCHTAWESKCWSMVRTFPVAAGSTTTISLLFRKTTNTGIGPTGLFNIISPSISAIFVRN